MFIFEQVAFVEQKNEHINLHIIFKVIRPARKFSREEYISRELL
jgi:hypothetical protein